MDDKEFKRPEGQDRDRSFKPSAAGHEAFRRPEKDGFRHRPESAEDRKESFGEAAKETADKPSGLSSFAKRVKDAKKDASRERKESRLEKKARNAEDKKENENLFMSFTAKRRAYEEERSDRLKNRELNRIRRKVRRRVSGKPGLPNDDITPFGLIGKFAGKLSVILIVLLCVAIVFVGGAGIGIVFGYITTATEVSTDLFKIKEQTSYVYDKNGKEIATLTGSSNINRELVGYDEVSANYIDEAFMAIEDRTFKTNIGIDPRRIISAVIGVVASKGSHGGSTITQQTIKMLTGDNEVSYQRKVQEWYRAVKLTEQLTKSEIMSLYLNLVPMGNNYVGIQSAAKAYFGKDAKNLNLAECALLAGIPKSPSSYNPRTELGRKNAQRRQRVVLDAMLQSGFISVDQFEDALNYELVYNHEEIKLTKAQINSYFEEYTIQEVINDLIAQKGYSRNVAYQMVMNGGVKIYTTLDPDAQDKMDEFYKDVSRFQTKPEIYINSPEIPQSGMVLLDNKNQSIVAMQGGFGEKTANMVFNRAVDARKQPGSTIKPLGVYSPAIELNIATGATIIKDEPVRMKPRSDDLWPRNAYRNYYGNMTMHDALKISSNVPAVKVLAQVGIENSRSYLKQMGIPLSPDDVGLAIGLGSFTTGISPLQLANAYMTLPNGGLYTKAKPYSQVLDADGNVLLEHDPEKTGDFTKVFEPSTAYMMEKIMGGVLQRPTGGTSFWGTANNIGPVKNEAGQVISTAAKTGTTDDQKDEWFAELTPYYTAVAWYGFDNRIKTSYIYTPDLFLIHHVVGDLMTYVHRDAEPVDFNRPADIIELRISTLSGQLATPGCGSHTRTEYFKAGSPLTPTQACPLHSNSGAPINYLLSDVGNNN